MTLVQSWPDAGCGELTVARRAIFDFSNPFAKAAACSARPAEDYRQVLLMDCTIRGGRFPSLPRKR